MGVYPPQGTGSSGGSSTTPFQLWNYLNASYVNWTTKLYYPLLDWFGGSATEANTQTLARAGTIKNLRINVVANTFNAALVIKLRKNGVDTALTVSIPANTIGTFSDTTHAIAFAVTDLMGWSVFTTATSGGITMVLTGEYV